MKHAMQKTLGLAALSGAFVAAGAGVASAGTAETLGAVTDTAASAVEGVPAESMAQNLPAGTAETLGETQDVVRPAGQMTSNLAGEAIGDKKQGGTMLGGLPVGTGLPALG